MKIWHKLLNRVINKRSASIISDGSENKLFVDLWDQLAHQYSLEFSQNSDFLRTSTVSNTTHPNVQKLATRYLNYLKDDPRYQTKYLPFLYDSPHGNPFHYTHLLGCSPLTIQHMAQYLQIRHTLGIDITEPNFDLNIVEFGGGYGNHYRLARNMGFKGGWEIYDLPGMLEIQKEYLSVVAPAFIEDIEFHNSRNFVSNTPIEKTNVLMAFFSISECSDAIKQDFISQLHNFDYIIIEAQKVFNGKSNLLFFQNIRELLGSEYKYNEFDDPIHFSGVFLTARKSKL